jgi:hypothetical protein
MQQGCQFFVSQTLWSTSSTKQLLRDLHTRSEREHKAPPPILITLSPCGSAQTLQLQEWLGVAVPPSVKQQLLAANDMLARSVDLAVEAFSEVLEFATAQGLRIGCNVESVSARPAEVDASVELVRRIDALRARADAETSRALHRVVAAEQSRKRRSQNAAVVEYGEVP